MRVTTAESAGKDGSENSYAGVPSRAAARPAGALVERFDIEPFPDFQPNEQTLQGSSSSVSTPNFASKYSLESS